MFIDDSTGTLTSTDRTNIENAAPARMDVKIVIASTGSRAELDASVGRLVNSGNTLAIGVDPVHHYTFTHFGSMLGIPSSNFPAIARAGNVEFKAGHWGDGLRAIVTSAASVQEQAPAFTRSQAPVIIQQPSTVIEHPVSAAPFVIGGIVIAAVLCGIIIWLRRRERAAEQERQAFREETERLQARNLEEQTWHDRMAKNQASSPVAPTTQPVPETIRQMIDRPVPASIIRERPVYQSPVPVVIPQSSSGNDLLTGLLVGQAMAERREPVYVDPPRHYSRSRTPTPVPSSSSSSWDSGSSSSSWDSGSSGGSFDSGSSGGGFDSGSSGSDF